jgi:hypothetical protein
MVLPEIVYVVTCEQCGQTWQRARVIDGQPMECIFCGWHGRLTIGLSPDAASTVAPRVEAWLMH